MPERRRTTERHTGVPAGRSFRWEESGRRWNRGRGRPAWRYSASGQAREPDARVRDYAALALVLAEHLSRSSRHPEADARAAGRAWGRLLTEGSDRRSPRSARVRTVALFKNGFAFVPGFASSPPGDTKKTFSVR